MASEADSGELSAFVSSTLKAIAEGVRDAQDTRIASPHSTGISGYNAPKTVEFDIAVSAKKTDTAGGGFKVAVFGIGANAKGDVGNENSTVSRIKFSVPTNFKRNKESSVIPSTLNAWNKDK